VIKTDPVHKPVGEKRRVRPTAWKSRAGYTRETTVTPEPPGTAGMGAAMLQGKIDALRRAK
jgi:hypothetical protein